MPSTSALGLQFSVMQMQHFYLLNQKRSSHEELSYSNQTLKIHAVFQNSVEGIYALRLRINLCIKYTIYCNVFLKENKFSEENKPK